MTRLPTPGKDSGTWGDILNDYLSTSHTSDGSLKDNTVGTSQLKDNSVGAAQLQAASVGASQLQAGAITESHLPDSISQDKITGLTDALNSKATSAQGALADTALQPGAAEALIANKVGTGGALDNALSSTYARAVSPLTALADKLRAGVSATVAIAGDSTSDEASEWWWRMWDVWSLEHPAFTLVSKWWDDATQAHVNTTHRSGRGADVVTCSSDTFTRTAAELVGSTSPRGGGAWSGGAGVWTLDGTSALWAASNGSYQSLGGGVAVGSVWKASGVATIDTTGNGTVKQLNLGASGWNGSLIRLGIIIQVDAAGGVSAKIDGQWPSYASVTSFTTLTSVTANAAQDVTWSLTVSGTAATAVINGQTITGTLTAPQAALATTFNACWVLTAGTCTGYRLKLIALETYPSAAPTLTVIVGSRAGVTLSYQQDRIAVMFPAGTIDALWVSSSHNYNTDSPATYLAAVEAFLDAYRVAHAEYTAIV